MEHHPVRDNLHEYTMRSKSEVYTHRDGTLRKFIGDEGRQGKPLEQEGPGTHMLGFKGAPCLRVGRTGAYVTQKDKLGHAQT